MLVSTTRPKAEIDDLVAFFESLGGVSRFKFNLEDSNEGSNSTETILCVCPRLGVRLGRMTTSIL